MTNFNIEIKGLPKLLIMLGPSNLKRAISDISFAVGEQVKDKIARAPGPVKKPIAWASNKQRRWFFAQMRAGNIEVPWRRQSSKGSQRLESKWVTEKLGATDAVVGTLVTYAPWVQSAEKQQPMHKATGWATDEKAVSEVVASGVIDRIQEQVFDKALGGG